MVLKRILAFVLLILLLESPAISDQYIRYPSVGGGGSGTVTSITAGTGLSGGTITTTGTISLTVPVTVPLGGTGNTSETLNGIIYGNGTGALGVTAAGTTGQVLTGVTGSAPVWAAPATSGTVTSVAETVPAFLSISGSPITTSGTLAIGLSGTALPVANGGTGDTTLTSNGVLYGSGTSGIGATAAGTTGQVLTGVTSGAPVWAAPATSGTVTSVAATVPAFLSVSGSPITSSGTLAFSLSGTALPLANGGTGSTAFTAGSIPYSNGTILTQDNSNLFWDGTNHRLGIGTAGPLNKLDVSGAVAIGSYAGVNTAPSNNLIVGGNIGIGTTSPTAQLNIYQTSSATPPAVIQGTSANSTYALTIIGAYPTDSGLKMQNTSGRTFVIRPDTNLNFIDQTAGLTRMVIDPNGNVGIGTTSPTTKLQVANGHIRSTITTAPTATVNANAGTGATCTLSNATDIAGTVNLTTTATSPASGTQCTVTFNSAYTVAPICVWSPNSSGAILNEITSGVYFTTTTTTMLVTFANADVTGHTYNYMFHCLETQ